MNNQRESAVSFRLFLWAAIRFAAYTAALLAAFLILPELGRHGNIAIFKEGGPVELCQLAVLLVTGGIFMFGAGLVRGFRRLFVLAALAAIFACVRELDSFFDELFPLFGWELFALAVVACGVLVARRNPRRLLKEMQEFIHGRGFAMLWVGFCVSVVLAQLVGHGAFLRMLMGDDYTRDYKRVIEELVELFGYTLLLVASIESVLQMRACQRALPARGPASSVG